MSVDLERAIVREINDLCPIHTQLLSTRAQKILDLYNEEEEIKLETAFLEAQNHCMFPLPFTWHLLKSL